MDDPKAARRKRESEQFVCKYNTYQDVTSLAQATPQSSESQNASPFPALSRRVKRQEEKYMDEIEKDAARIKEMCGRGGNESGAKE